MRQAPKAKDTPPVAASRARARGADLARKLNMLAEVQRGACLQKFGVDVQGSSKVAKVRRSPFPSGHKEQPEEEPEEQPQQPVETPKEPLVEQRSQGESLSPAVRRSAKQVEQGNEEPAVAQDLKQCTDNATKSLTRTAPSLPLKSLAQVCVAEESKTPASKTPTCNSLELTDTVLRKSEMLLAELTASLIECDKDEFCLHRHEDLQSMLDEEESWSSSSCSSPIAQPVVSTLPDTVEVPLSLLDMFSTTLSNYQNMTASKVGRFSMQSFDSSESSETQAPEGSEPELSETDAPETPNTPEGFSATTSCQTASRCMSPQPDSGRSLTTTPLISLRAPSVRRAASSTISPQWYSQHLQASKGPANLQLYRQASPPPRVHRIQILAPGLRQQAVAPIPVGGYRQARSCKIKAQEITTITKSLHLTVEIS